jgi:hypothetical protein
VSAFKQRLCNLRIMKTNRGETDITVDSEDIYPLSGGCILMKDINGIRYLSPIIKG